jgi:hypothetical protein
MVRTGVWQNLHKGCSQYPDLQYVLIESTITRAHAWRQGLLGVMLKEKKANLAEVHRTSGYTHFVKRAPGSSEGKK